jgi:two-component system sensor histidine kinase KdpD
MESERLRNTLLAALSHDLRTPLTALVGLAETSTRPPQRSPDMPTGPACGASRPCAPAGW